MTLTIRNLTPATWDMIRSVAPVMHASRLFGVTSPEAAAAIMVKGFELGLPLAASFEFIQIVQGKPTLSPRGALALIQRSGELAGMQIMEKPGACTVSMRRTNGFAYTLTWTREDAERTGQVKTGSAWVSYPANMLRWRAIGFVADVVFPDIIGGVRRADEFGATIDQAGNVIEAQWVEVTALPPPAPLPPEPPVLTVETLVERFGAGRVLAANNGLIPTAPEELLATLELLEREDANLPPEIPFEVVADAEKDDIT